MKNVKKEEISRITGSLRARETILRVVVFQGMIFLILTQNISGYLFTLAISQKN